MLDLSNVKVEVKRYDDMWQDIKDATMTTISKDKGVYPTSEWKERLLMSEHSPIRIGYFIIKVHNIPTFVATHFARHWNGIEKFVSTRRDDRGDWDKPADRNTPVDMTIDVGFQAVMNISHVRFCTGASIETRKVWQLIVNEIKKLEPELAKMCVPTCVYRNGLCPEMFPCGYNHTKMFERQLKDYIKGFESQVNKNTLIN